ncbi:MAG: type II toxin-antitoxin system RelE/ParE family toxin [Alphaproteobacteria bacterium]|nr:type II toxin-antitoxin system RelE/ParE family toxin [Alphaproteobacteria bacterium]
MHKLNPTKDALEFWDSLDAKQYRQTGRKILSLLLDPYPKDSKALIGYPEYFRVDCGEYRIIYKVEEDTIKLTLIGARNDGDVYRKFKRKLSVEQEDLNSAGQPGKL